MMFLTEIINLCWQHILAAKPNRVFIRNPPQIISSTIGAPLNLIFLSTAATNQKLYQCRRRIPALTLSHTNLTHNIV